MLHAKFRGKSTCRFRKRRFLTGFYNIEVWRPSWSCFTIYGHGGHLGHVTSIMSSDFHFLVPESFHAKFGSDRHSSF